MNDSPVRPVHDSSSAIPSDVPPLPIEQQRMARHEWNVYQRSRAGVVILLSCLAVAMGTLFMLPILMGVFSPNDPGATLVYFGFGVACAAVHALAFSSVLISSRNAVKRFLLCVTAGYLLLFCNLAGVMIDDGMYFDWDDAIAFCLMIPPACLVVQIPYWVVRIRYKWLIDFKHAVLPPMSIQNIMVATAIIAFAVATQQSAFNGEISSQDDIFMVMASFAAALLGIGFITTPTYLRLGLRTEQATGLQAVSIFFPFAAFAVAVVAFAFFQTVNAWMTVIIGLIVAGFCISTSVIVYGMRAIGLRLHRGTVDEPA